MALPPSGTISMDNMNTDRGISSMTQIDLDTAAIAYNIPTKPHGMNEFYGLSTTPPPPPAPPPPPPPPTFYYHYVEPCGGGTPVYTVRHTSFIDTNKAVTLVGLGGCWKATGTAGVLYDYAVATVYADCTACASTPPPPPPPALSITNGSVTCSGGGNFTSTLSGGTGTYTYVAIDTSQANVSNAINGISGTRVSPSGGSSHTWSSLADGTYYTAVMDSGGTVDVETISVVVNCTSPPPPPPPPPPTVYYYNATRCDNSTNYIIYGGTNYYGTGIVVISGTTTYCYTIQNEVGVQAYVDTVGASVANCGNASCYVTPPPPPPPPPPSVTVSFTTGCSGGQTYVNLTATTTNQTTTPSYSWLVTLDSGTDFSNSANYISPQNNSGLANGSYYVAAYDTANGDYDMSCCTANQGCSPPPPPPPPPGPTYYYNNSYRNSCNGASPCNDDGVEVVLRSTSALSNGSWYSDGSKSYQPYGSTSGPSYGVDIDPYIYTEAGNCETACNNF
jgi:hypothetical protein